VAKKDRTNGNVPKKKRHVFGTIMLILGTMILIGIIAFGIFCMYFYRWVESDMSTQTYLKLEDYILDETSVIYYQDRETGEWKELQKLYARENRIWTDSEKIPKMLEFACVSIEDKRFYEHDGVDWLRTIKACGMMFIGRSSFGGSTINQQLVKNLTHENDVTVRRKLTEIYRALQLDVDYEKSEIMEMYLNTIYFGRGCYGVESASLKYFGKDVWDLTLAECASLIGITNNPSLYDPYVFPEQNRKRQLTVLDQMLQQGYISQQEHDAAVAQEMVFTSASTGAYQNVNGYYSYAVDQVLEDVIYAMMEQTGYSYDVAYDMVTSGGYAIYSTIDLDAQTKLEEVFENEENLPETESSQQLQGAAMIMDNETGDVVALVGGTGEKTGTLLWNRATDSLLQPGSVIKPLTVFAPALEMGIITPISVMDDTPLNFVDDGCWPRNSSGTYHGLVSMTTAMAESLNTVAVKLVEQMGEEYCMNFAQARFGIDTFVTERDELTDLTLWGMGLGSLTDGIRLQSIAEAYTCFANQGEFREGRTFTEVRNRYGEVILENEQASHQAISEKNAWYLTHMMEATVTMPSGTATEAQLGDIAVAGKTGTTENDFDRWFAGYTPYYTCVVWNGYDTPESIVTTDGSGNPATALWTKVMSALHADLPAKQFEQPGYIVECSYCADSGMVVAEACQKDIRGDRTVTGLIALEDIPEETCTNHWLVDICGSSDHLANEYCYEQARWIMYKLGMLKIERFYPIAGITVEDQDYNYAGKAPAGLVLPETTQPGAVSMECYYHVEDVEVKTYEELVQEGVDAGMEEMGIGRENGTPAG